MASEPGLHKLREMAVSGEFKVPKFRSVVWNIFLSALNKSPDTWIEQRTQQRRYYREIKHKHILDPHLIQMSEEKDNPLSQSKDSIWNQHFRDTELRNLIRQDVVRTNPNVDFYRKENIQEIMIDLLFCYAREYPSICYRQGMHEILAPLIFVLHSDHQNLAHIQEETEISLDTTLETVLNPFYLEEDSYHLFCRIMNSLELFYRINDMTITESGQLTHIPECPDSPKASKKTSEIEVVHQLDIIRDKIFAKQDLHLHNHLLKLEIPLAFFGIRWLRLLFGREFNLLDLLRLWDAIFGVDEDLVFTYYIVVAMLIHVRDKREFNDNLFLMKSFQILYRFVLVIGNDYTSCLTLLMRYPQNADVMLIIRHALYMKNPEKYQCPPNAFVYVVNSVKQHHKMKQSPLRQNLPHPKIFPHSALAAMAVTNATDYRTKQATTLRRNTSDDLRQETAKVTHEQVTKTQVNDDGIVDGYMLDDPEVIKMELQDSYNIMTVSRIKLLQYVSVLRKHIPGNHVDELHQTLDGIEELCSLLKPKHQYLFSVVAPVDPAFEADDEDTLEGSAMAPRSFPLSVKKPKKQTESYEVPNNRVSKTTSQMLQLNRKEVEMNVIRQSAVGCLDPSQYPSNNPAGDRRNSE